MGPEPNLSGTERLVLAWLVLATAVGLCCALVRVVLAVVSWLAIAPLRAGGAS